MAEYQRSDIRVSDTEREDALGKLGQHMTEGRLTIDEYGDRTAKVAAAKTRGEVLTLFDDLPDPRPTFGRPSPPPATREPRTVSTAQKIAPVLIPIALVMAAVALTFALRVPIFFLLPFIFFLASGRGWGHGYRSGGPRR
ncbi:hypothetical protein BLA60_41560 [Actinophytocola xinjiangensis]|uniref:DUF1707 domain-containing protein n=1 Tax=Actinophytocola xinjiangensis TaxID=485602 RepID=A0A7Z1ATD2_9PSEU|nr:DUF1707 domain-containing protein [Actinophytocola xinjiangensis]OLF04285.1 hypothetical protein BLA60_41560 [Actinophytocola xinjiangensis]